MQGKEGNSCTGMCKAACVCFVFLDLMFCSSEEYTAYLSEYDGCS